MTSINKIISISLVWLLFPLASSAQKKHFEGEITYNASIALDKTARKFLKGSDGAYTIKTIYKNGDELSQEDYFGAITLISRNRDSVYTYLPEIKKGYKCSYSASIGIFKESRKNVESSVKETGETKEMYDMTFKRYKGSEVLEADLLVATIPMTEEHDYWVCTDYDDFWFNNIRIPGLIFSLDWFAKGKIPILGEMTQHFDMSIKELKAREVSDDEFAIPSDISFTIIDDMNTADAKLKKDHKKLMKSKGKKVGEDIQTRGAGKTKGDWDF